MNFSYSVEQNEQAMELKYCERCGGLWFRSHASDECFCRACRATVAALPPVRRRAQPSKQEIQHESKGYSQARRGAKYPDLTGHSCGEQLPASIEMLLGVAEQAPSPALAMEQAEVCL